jgi:prevent-host-death family protein
MVTVNMHEAKTQLSKLVDRAVQGEAFVIAKAGTPLVKVTALDVPREPQRLGFLAGEIDVPEDFDNMGETEIAALFESGGGAQGSFRPAAAGSDPL